MQHDLIETLIKFGTISGVIIFGMILLAVLGSGTSMGRAMLPRSVTDAASSLLPWSRITDAIATGDGDFRLKVAGNAQLQTVYVRSVRDMTIAWTFDPAAESPQTGTYAFTRLRHNLKQGSKIVPEEFEARVRQALIEVLAPKQFYPADLPAADLCISVFGAIENEVAVQDLGAAFDRPNDREWTSAIATALSQNVGEKITTIARGSLMLDVVDRRSSQVLWHALAVASFVVELSDAEKYRRTQAAIAEMLRKFPPRRQ